MKRRAIFLSIFVVAACEVPNAPQGEGTVVPADTERDDLGNAPNDATDGISDHKGVASKLTDPMCTDPDLAKVAIGVSFMKCDGTMASGTMSAAESDPGLTAENIKVGATIAGVAGILVPSPELCATDGQTDCVTSGTYKAAKMANFTDSDIRSGVNIAGVAGSLTGAPASCAADGDTGCIANASYKAAKMANFAAADVKSTVTIAGVPGSAILESHVACASDGALDCITDSNYRAAKMANFAAADVKSTVTIAGVPGSAILESHVTCASDGALGCITDSNYKAAKMANFAAADVKTTVTIAGIPGSATLETHSNCSSDGQTNCVAVTAYPAAYVNNSFLSPRNIKRGVVIGGVTGVFPSAAYPVPRYSDSGATTNTVAGDTTTPLSNFITQITSSGAFEFWDSTGVRRTGSGDPDIVAANIRDTVAFENLSLTGTYGGANPSAWDIRYGVTVNGVPGRLKVNCRNMRGTNYDNVTAPAVSGTDIWDTVDDYNNFGSYPSFNPWTDQFRCGFDSVATADEKTWAYVSGANANALFKDRISGSTWTRGTGTGAQFWQDAITYCDGLDHGSFQDWRLPTQKELMDAYSHGIYDLVDQANPGLGTDLSAYFWSSSTRPSNTIYAWVVDLSNGTTGFGNKTTGSGVLVLCTR